MGTRSDHRGSFTLNDMNPVVTSIYYMTGSANGQDEANSVF